MWETRGPVYGNSSACRGIDFMLSSCQTHISYLCGCTETSGGYVIALLDWRRCVCWWLVCKHILKEALGDKVAPSIVLFWLDLWKDSRHPGVGLLWLRVSKVNRRVKTLGLKESSAFLLAWVYGCGNHGCECPDLPEMWPESPICDYCCPRRCEAFHSAGHIWSLQGTRQLHAHGFSVIADCFIPNVDCLDSVYSVFQSTVERTGGTPLLLSALLLLPQNLEFKIC